MSVAADRFITIFSPEGLLWQVEFAAKAVKQSEITAIGVKGQNAIVVCVEKKIPNQLVEPSTVTHMFRITPHVGACLVGLAADVSYLSRILRYYATNFQYDNGFEMPISLLATRLSEIHQQESQFAGLRPTAVSALIFGYDAPSDDFSLFKVDPSGNYSGYKAVACESKEIEVMQAIEKILKPPENNTSDEQIAPPPPLETAGDVAKFIMTNFQSILSTPGVFENSQFEMAVITKNNTKFRLMEGQTYQELLSQAAAEI